VTDDVNFSSPGCHCLIDHQIKDVFANLIHVVRAISVLVNVLIAAHWGQKYIVTLVICSSVLFGPSQRPVNKVVKEKESGLFPRPIPPVKIAFGGCLLLQVRDDPPGSLTELPFSRTVPIAFARSALFIAHITASCFFHLEVGIVNSTVEYHGPKVTE